MDKKPLTPEEEIESRNFIDSLLGLWQDELVQRVLAAHDFHRDRADLAERKVAAVRGIRPMNQPGDDFAFGWNEALADMAKVMDTIDAEGRDGE